MGMIEAGGLFGKATNFNQTFDVASTSLQLFGGYRFHRLLAIGGTFGLDSYTFNTLAPVGIGLRGIILNSRFSPYYSLNAGYGFTLDSGSERPTSNGGWMMNPALGLKANLSEKTAFLLTFGYQTQRAGYFSYGRSSQTEREFLYRRMSARFGLMF